MKEPTTAEEIKVLHELLRSDPDRYLQIVNGWIADNPGNSHAYFDRHFAWMKMGQPGRAIDDLNKVIELDPAQISLLSRGEVYRRLGQYGRALEDFARAEAMDPTQWQDDAFGLLYQADCHARLGDEASALGCCARLHDDFWTPGMNNTPGGGKAEIAQKLRQLVADARHRHG